MTTPETNSNDMNNDVSIVKELYGQMVTFTAKSLEQYGGNKNTVFVTVENINFSKCK
jgi:hypothetical protein